MLRGSPSGATSRPASTNGGSNCADGAGAAAPPLPASSVAATPRHAMRIHTGSRRARRSGAPIQRRIRAAGAPRATPSTAAGIWRSDRLGISSRAPTAAV